MNHPERLGKYRITDVLGEGAMGIVYKAFDPDIRRAVALKTIRSQVADSGSAQARFRNEAQAAGRLAHPGIVAVYDFGVDADVAFIAMEFVEGHTLAHYLLNRVRFTDADIPGVMCQVLDALDHAHEQGVWHRDVKPANIIMASNGRLKVADFGIARIEDTQLTQANVMIGTPTYMAPEQFLGTPMDRRVDVYSAGVLLYLLLTGRPPFLGNQEQLTYKVVHEAPLMPSQIENADRPRFYDAILARALAKHPDERYASAAAFSDAIRHGVGQPFDTTAWEQTLVKAAGRIAKPAAPAAGRAGTGGSSAGWSGVPAHWDLAALKRAEQSLARHVGPLAGVMVRRAARECADLPSLLARLAEQVGNPAARSAFVGETTAIIPRGGGGVAPPNAASNAPPPAAAGNAAPLPQALVDAAQKLLAQRVGPIAQVMARKAAGRSSDAQAFFVLLAEHLPEGPARQQLLAELRRLG
ncbi:MAG: serine/threonine protein kinase [Proteobacteria bacterium]|nr:serine/threonine protein kinase [Pseudomonadota bacterium]